MHDELMTYEQLVKRVKSQDEVIAQLIKVVAATNKRLTQFINEQQLEYEQKLIN